MVQTRESKNAQRRALYHKNKNNPSHYVTANQIKHRKLRQEKLLELKSFPCVNCGIMYPPCVMEFHHRDPETKVTTVSKIRLGDMESEAAKCDLLCANCHRLRHHGLA